MVVQGAAVGPVFARRRCRTEPASSHSERVAQAHWRCRPQNKSRAASPCLRQPSCNEARAEQPLWWCKGLLSAVNPGVNQLEECRFCDNPILTDEPRDGFMCAEFAFARGVELR